MHKTRLITGIVLSGVVVGTYFLLPIWCFSLLLGIVTALMIYELVILSRKVGWLIDIIPLYPLLPMFMLMVLNHTEYRPLLMYLIGLVAVHDTGAYIAGHLWGTHRLAPSISPGKTFEGCLGGFVSVLGVLLVLRIPASFVGVLSLAYAIACTSVTGDLFESWIKRKAGVKDSGNLLPGHGGILDRCDALVFTGVLFYLMRDTLSRMFLSF